MRINELHSYLEGWSGEYINLLAKAILLNKVTITQDGHIQVKAFKDGE